MRRIELFFDYACPWCRLATETVRALAAEGVEVRYRAWKMPANAAPPPKPPGYREAGRARLEALHEAAGTRFIVPRKVDSRLALTATKVAEALGAAGPYVEAVFRAYWGEDRDISERAVLVALAAQVDLDAEAFAAALAQGQGEAALARDLEDAVRLELSTIPSFVSGDKRLLVHHFDDMPSYEVVRALALRAAPGS